MKQQPNAATDRPLKSCANRPAMAVPEVPQDQAFPRTRRLPNRCRLQAGCTEKPCQIPLIRALVNQGFLDLEIVYANRVDCAYS